MKLPPGYRSLKVITPGPTFLVDLATRDHDEANRFAVKRIAPRFEGDVEARAQIATEASILRHLAGQHAPELVERGDDFLVTHWVERDTGTFAPSRAREAFIALAELHRQGIVHGDLHAGNMLVEAETHRIVFVDFALAALGEASSTAPQAGDVRGHYFTMAPEIARGAPATQASDVFALGATLAALAFGTVLREPLHPAAMLAHAGSAAPDATRLLELLEGASPATAAAVRAVVATLAFEPSARPTALEAATMARATK